MEFYPDATNEDIYDTLIGKHIGSGEFRHVYERAGNERNAVVTIECNVDARYFSNVLEYEVWTRVKGTKYEKWFAPVYWIGRNGRVLIQARTKPTENRPSCLPDFFTDCKLSNFGIYNGKFVAHDYGLIRFVDNYTVTMVKPKWLDL